MKPITYEKAAKKADNPTVYKDGFNTAVSMANKELAEKDAEIQRLTDQMQVCMEMKADIKALWEGAVKELEELNPQYEVLSKLSAKQAIIIGEKDLEIQRLKDMVRRRADYHPDNSPDMIKRIEHLEKQVEILCDNAETDSDRIEKLEAYLIPISKAPTAAKVMADHEDRIKKLESKLITDDQAMDTLYCDIKEMRELLTATIDTMNESITRIDNEQSKQIDFANLLGENLKWAVMDGDKISITSLFPRNEAIITKIK